nr:uncharacterized protein LOC113808029 [Penaeus vannamei]
MTTRVNGNLSQWQVGQVVVEVVNPDEMPDVEIFAADGQVSGIGSSVRAGSRKTTTKHLSYLKVFWDDKGVNIDGEYLRHLKFADDMICDDAALHKASRPHQEPYQLISLSSASREQEIKRRITMGWEAFGRAGSIFKDKTLSVVIKIRICDQCILQTVTYGVETWNLATKQMLKLRSMQRAHELIMLNVIWKDKKTAKWIREQTKTNK